MLDPYGRPLPNLQAMGAIEGVKDLFIEIGYMDTDFIDGPDADSLPDDVSYGGTLKPAHSHLPGHADEVLLTKPLDVAGTDVGVVPREGVHHVAHGQAVGQQLRGMRRDMKLFHEAADGVDLRDAREIAQLRADHPVLQFAQVSR